MKSASYAELAATRRSQSCDSNGGKAGCECGAVEIGVMRVKIELCALRHFCFNAFCSGCGKKSAGAGLV